jgi:hypothetical protein
MYVYMCMYIRIYLYMHVYVYEYIHMFIYTNIYVYVYIYIKIEGATKRISRYFRYRNKNKTDFQRVPSRVDRYDPNDAKLCELITQRRILRGLYLENRSIDIKKEHRDVQKLIVRLFRISDKGKNEAHSSFLVRAHRRSLSCSQHQREFDEVCYRETSQENMLLEGGMEVARDIAITDLLNQTKSTSSIRPFNMAKMTTSLMKHTMCLTRRENQSNLIKRLQLHLILL